MNAQSNTVESILAQAKEAIFGMQKSAKNNDPVHYNTYQVQYATCIESLVGIGLQRATAVRMCNEFLN
jgi:hypothetical protein